MSFDARAAVIGGGVVGCAVAHALARAGVGSIVLEADSGLALGASGTNSGILHTGFDSPPGTLETELILRSAALRELMADELDVQVWRCGARLEPQSEQERGELRRLHENASRNGVEASLEDGALLVPGESVTDPVAFVHALAAAAEARGAQVMLSARVCGLASDRRGGWTLELEGERRLRTSAVINCAGLFADEIARLAGDEPFEIYPRKGEFLVFASPADEPLRQILLALPSPAGKGVLVFPTLDGHVIAGPTAREREDKHDWSVEADAAELILERALRIHPPLARARRVGAYAGLRPAGRGATNYLIARSRVLPGLIHAAAIRSTGLSASLAIGEHVTRLLAAHGDLEPASTRPQRASRAPIASRAPRAQGPWWGRAAQHRGAGTQTQRA